MKKYFITALVVLVLATLWSMWRENCVDGCRFSQVVFGWPVFLRTPFAPEAGAAPEFFLVPLIVNLMWTAGVSFFGWAVFDTLARWQDRKRSPEVPDV